VERLFFRASAREGSLRVVLQNTEFVLEFPFGVRLREGRIADIELEIFEAFRRVGRERADNPDSPGGEGDGAARAQKTVGLEMGSRRG
jgi:hypothetical protein